MKFLVKFWHDFKLQPDVWFFYGFLLTFTLSVRKVLFFYPINGRFNEWTGIYLYLSDIFLIITIFLWVISILRNKNVNLSIDDINLWLKQAIIYLPRHQKQGITRWWVVIKEYVACKFSNRSVSFWCGGVPLLIVFWSFISILWSENQNIALFKAIKLLEFYLFYLYVIFRLFHLTLPLFLPRRRNEGEVVNKGGVIKNTFRIIIALGFIQAIIGIWQFIIQHSIGLFWLKESLISLDISGVAKIMLNGEKFIRAYGLFPHPNILGGFLLVSIILIICCKKLFHVEQFNQCHSCESRNPVNKFLSFLDSGSGAGMTTLMTLSLVIQIIALILTFSKSAILGLIIAFLYVLWKNKEMFHPVKEEIVSRETISFHGAGIEHLGRKVAIIAIILILSLYLAGLNFGENLEKSYGDRIDQLVIWKSITQNNLLLGTGTGNYLFHMKHLYPNLETWQYQPVHNVFLLIWSELGIIGMGLFVWFLWKIFIWTPSVQFWTKGILAGFIFIMLFDHYFWDIQQGQIMLWMILGLVAGYTTEKNKIFY